jgi:catechol 2,3-dioxygenase-like lactoylglutathione lyase family enzyme
MRIELWDVRYPCSLYFYSKTLIIGGERMATIKVRYIVDDVDATIAFYTQHLDFTVKAHPAPAFAVLQRGDLNLLVNAKDGPGGAAQAMPDGRKPEPGGWNRIQIEVDDLRPKTPVNP